MDRVEDDHGLRSPCLGFGQVRFGIFFRCRPGLIGKCGGYTCDRLGSRLLDTGRLYALAAGEFRAKPMLGQDALDLLTNCFNIDPGVEANLHAVRVLRIPLEVRGDHAGNAHQFIAQRLCGHAASLICP